MTRNYQWSIVLSIAVLVALYNGKSTCGNNRGSQLSILGKLYGRVIVGSKGSEWRWD